MDKVESCYIQPIRYIFSQPNIFVGAMGGRPDAALYFVGLQNDELIFLDPHLVQDSVNHEEYMFDDWQSLDGDQSIARPQNSKSKYKK